MITRKFRDFNFLPFLQEKEHINYITSRRTNSPRLGHLRVYVFPQLLRPSPTMPPEVKGGEQPGGRDFVLMFTMVNLASFKKRCLQT